MPSIDPNPRACAGSFRPAVDQDEPAAPETVDRHPAPMRAEALHLPDAARAPIAAAR